MDGDDDDNDKYRVRLNAIEGPKPKKGLNSVYFEMDW